MRRPSVATLAARSSLPCCCTRAGSDVIRVFIRDVKQASRLGRKGRKDGVVGLHELDQALGELGILGSQLHQARAWQEIKQQGEELTLGLIHGIWRAETGLWLEQADIPWVPNPCVGWLCLFWDPFIQTQRGTHGHRKQSRRLGSEASVSSPPLLSPTSSQASLDQPRCGDHKVEEDVAAGLQADLHAVRQH